MEVSSSYLVTNEASASLDAEASKQWGLNSSALVEAAGRACAEQLVNFYSIKEKQKIIILAGSGNNAADALVMLKALILKSFADANGCSVYITRKGALEAEIPLEKLGVTIKEWDEKDFSSSLKDVDFIIDGITGTGIKGPLKTAALEMANALNGKSAENKKPFVVSIDIPSGGLVKAHATLAIEPQKLCLYTPSLRENSGKIIPVGGIFPPALIEKYSCAELVIWENASTRIPPADSACHKYKRGLVEIRAGSEGCTGAAKLSSLGAQAAGAGLVRLIVDPALYPLIAPACSGVMAASSGLQTEEGRFRPDAVLLGPGWGRTEERKKTFESFLPLEKQGVPLILDADALPLAKDVTFNGNAILTPHTGEFSALCGLSKEEILSDTVNILGRCAKEKNATVLFKSHVMYVASPDGRIGIIDGMQPLLASGGTGDVLAGFCAALCARVSAANAKFDGYACACTAASLLIEAAKSDDIKGRFIDPAELAHAASVIAGRAWLNK